MLPNVKHKLIANSTLPVLLASTIYFHEHVVFVEFIAFVAMKKCPNDANRTTFQSVPSKQIQFGVGGVPSLSLADDDDVDAGKTRCIKFITCISDIDNAVGAGDSELFPPEDEDDNDLAGGHFHVLTIISDDMV